jgi:NF-X1-type zinc finger protein NFXL1
MPAWPQDWARNQLDAAALRASNAGGGAAAAPEYGCPKCRFAYPAAEAPRAYTCFCGKQRDPEWDP